MSLGMAWGVGGWLMPFHFDKRVAPPPPPRPRNTPFSNPPWVIAKKF